MRVGAFVRQSVFMHIETNKLDELGFFVCKHFRFALRNLRVTHTVHF